MASNRLHTQDPVVQLFGLNARDRAIREHLQNRLTETQFRRTVLLHGLDTGQGMSHRQIAEAEGVTKYAVTDSLRQVEDKLKNDAHLWVLWVLGKHFTLPDGGHSEGSRDTYDVSDPITEDELLEIMTTRGGRILDSRDEDIRWESDRFHPASAYDMEVDRLNDEFDAGEITRVEWQAGLVMALADEQNPDGDDAARVELRQELEWAFGGLGLGVLSQNECDRRVAKALRSYVRGA